jgi:GntR family transcriptional repressor for pyruvate dehydrogenase complex
MNRVKSEHAATRTVESKRQRGGAAPKPNSSKKTKRGKGANRIKVSEKVAEELISLIKKGRLKEGDRLPSEHELMATLGVGRSSVREAIQGLAVAGILDVRRPHGTFVVSSVSRRLSAELSSAVTYWAVRDIYQVREVLEGFATAQAARLATPADIQEIALAQDEMIKDIRAGRRHDETNRKYHLAIARTTRNLALVYCLSCLLGSYREAQASIDEVDSVPEDDIADHERILACIKAREPEKAQITMVNHLRKTFGRVQEPENADPPHED